MNGFSGILAAASLALGVALAGTPAMAQQPKQAAPAPAAQPLKPASPAALAAAKEILAMKNASAMYAKAVPNIAEATINALTPQNLNYQKDLNEVAIIVGQHSAARVTELGEGMSQVYANEFSEQE